MLYSKRLTIPIGKKVLLLYYKKVMLEDRTAKKMLLLNVKTLKVTDDELAISRPVQILSTTEPLVALCPQ